MDSTHITSVGSLAEVSENSVQKTSTLRRVSGRVLMVLVSLVIAFALAEAALRIIDWPAPGLEVNGRGPIALRLPGANGGAYPPGTSGRLRHYDYNVGWTTNADGFRDRELSPKQPGEWRVGILGDSFAAGVGVEQAQRFPDLWYDAIRSEHPRVTLWNLASPLCGTVCEKEIFNGVGRKYDLDEVLLVFYGGNDVEDNFESITHPGKQDPYTDLPRSERAREWLRENVRLTSFLWVNGIRAFARFKPTGIYSQTHLNRYWPYTAKALTEVKQSIEPRRLTILYIPALPEWNDQSWQRIREQSGAGEDGRFVVKNAIKEWAQQQNIGFIDSTVWLTQCHTANECTFPTDGHLNVRGHSIIGKELTSAWRIGRSDEKN